MTPAPHLNDLDLTTNDITVLESADELIHLFAQLGYDVGETPSLPHAALSLDTDDLTQRILSIRRIASAHDSIAVYLFKVRSVTVALTQQIARRFRERLGDHLLILTSDYEKLDFVLLDRDQASKSSATGSAIRYTIRPRILTVNRHQPDPVALRVLRRFTLTEPDDLLQWDKLRSAYTLAEWSEPEFNNRALFSDYYLKHRVADEKLNPAWKEDVRLVAGEVKKLIAGARQKYGGQLEAEARTGLIEPIFRLLGLNFTPVKAGNSDAYTPDYILHAPGAPDKPLALALTYAWNRNLDAVDPLRDTETSNENPGALVASLLEKAAAPWVIMTNGKLWRLYATSASNRVTNYYEIDLEEALFAPGADRESTFKYWWLLFRRAAFTGFLDKVLAESQEYAKQIGERLKDRIFKRIFGYFAGGFIQHMRDQDIADADIDRETVFHATMTFLYRLMFILYAESLELLPVKEESGYGEHSLKRLKSEIASAGGAIEDDADVLLKKAFRDNCCDLYGRLQTLFAAIDTGNPDLNLPMYNGGLFSPDTPEGQFLHKYAIPDVYVALGLDRLARDRDDKTQALVFIDFKSLGVRQLGSIYEGLLEFKLRIADQKLAVIREKGRELYMPYAQANKAGKNIVDEVKPGRVYIENTKQERKATGSYYTPDYIVKYIVQHTVGPVLDAKTKALAPRLRAMQARYREHKEQVDFKNRQHSSAAQPPELFWNADPDTPLGRDIQQLADDCLSVRVLDPAMGSGHFLVEVVDYISNRLLDFLNAWTDNPVRALIERTRADILAEMERQGVSIDPARLTDVALLRRAVLKRCVYGVDLNPMAVELAKVSLWLDAFTLGAPLSFLDHHLKCGNSLIGARVKEVQGYLAENTTGMVDMFAGSEFAGVMLATDLMRQVSYLSDNTASQVAQSRAQYRQAGEHLAPYKRLLDVYTSRWFGNSGTTVKKVKTESVKLFLQDAKSQNWLKDPAKLPAKGLLGNEPEIASTTVRASAQYRFFHWELEFPEVFFAPRTPGGQDVQLRADGGFDAVVGNPPWVDVQELSPPLSQYQRLVYRSARGKYDQYALFIEAELKLIHMRGRIALITPSKFFVTEYGEGIRGLLAAEASLVEIVDLADTPIFEDASTYPVIVVAKRRDATVDGSHRVTLTQFPRNSRELASLANGIFSQLLRGRVTPPVSQYEISSARFADEAIWRLEPSVSTDLWVRMQEVSEPFREHVVAINLGVKTGMNELFVLQGGRELAMPVEASMFRPLVTARDLNRFIHDEPQAKIIFPYEETDSGKLREVELGKYPGLRAYFEGIKVRLSSRRWFGKTVVEAGMNWYGLLYVSQNAQRPKFMFPKIASSTLFSWDPTGEAILLEPGYIAIPKTLSSAHFLLAVLNSRLLGAFIVGQSTRLAGGFTELQVRYVESLPIRRISFTTSVGRREQLAESGRRLYQRCLSEGHACVLDFTAERLAQDESDAVHDLLAFLAEQMIVLNKRKQAEVKRFLGWLEARLHIRPDKDGTAGIDSLTGKTILQGYLGDYQKGEPETPFEDFFYRLHQNRGRFGVSLSDLKAEIEDEYRKSLDVLLPIKAQLATTDALIDRVVYQLYGLTDEEIRLIEYPGLEQAVASARQDVLKEKDVEPASDEAVEKIAAKVEQAAGQYLARVDESQIKAELRAEIPGWDGLPGNVRTFLITGELLLRQSALPDYSPVVISFGKAAEVALNERLFVPFRAAHHESDCDNQVLRRFMAGTKTLSLGAMPIVLASNGEHKLRAFVTGRYPNAASTILSHSGLLARLTQDQIDRYRNSAAHDAVLTADDARAARQWAIEILGYV